MSSLLWREKVQDRRSKHKTELIRDEDRYYILASSSLADSQKRILKQADLFAVFDYRGNLRPFGFEDHGVFFQGTRFLSHLNLKFNEKTPLLLSSNVKENNDFLVVDLTNPDFEALTGERISRGSIHLVRTIFLFEGCYYEQVKISNFGQKPVAFRLTFELAADFVDIFEVRGLRRKKRGRLFGSKNSKNMLSFSYQGLDHQFRQSIIRFKPVPKKVSEHDVLFLISLEPHQTKAIEWSCVCSIEHTEKKARPFSKAFRTTRVIYDAYRKNASSVETANEQFNDWLNQSQADLNMLLTRTEYGFYPFAGIPWFSTVFGRDGIITAFETLWLNPGIAKGVLNYLAATQATEHVAEQDAEPGKILHETRKGEMANLREIPFGKYYGTIDATPLFIMLAGAYYERTADRQLMEHIWPNVEAALNWIDCFGDMDGDGFVEYKCRAEGGLSNQGWKDSDDSVSHVSGKLASSPIALCEVQGYVYRAKLNAANLAGHLGLKKRAVELNQQAEVLKRKFQRAFWCEREGIYAMALDGAKRACKIMTSNAGHALWTGIATPSHAKRMAAHFMSDRFFTGWGIRTLAVGERRYNPMSYHNGSVWPHDNALLAFGLARYGLKEEAMRIMAGLFDASLFLELHRLPELFCGFERRKGEGPTLYPVACDPQAWAAGSAFLMLQACLGLSIDGLTKRAYFRQPALPPFLEEVRIKNLKVCDATLDLTLRRHPNDVGINVSRKDGEVEVIATK